MANDCIHRRGVFRHGTSNLALSPADDPFSNGTPGDPATSSATSPYSSPPPEYTEIEFKVEYCKISLILVFRLCTYGSDQIYSTAINNRVNRSRSKHGYKIQSFLFLWIKAKPSYYHLPSYEDAVKREEGRNQVRVVQEMIPEQAPRFKSWTQDGLAMTRIPLTPCLRLPCHESS